jgi:glucuronate isomerase
MSDDLSARILSQVQATMTGLGAGIGSIGLQERLYAELVKIPLIDPHSHINPHAPASKTLADLLGYHYYTELAHSAGMPRERIEAPQLAAPRDKVHVLSAGLPPLENTVQYSWLLDMARTFFDFREERVTADNWQEFYDKAAARMAAPDWEDQVLRLSNLEKVFLTNDFDDPLQGFDTDRYIPCLRTDDLVFHLAGPGTALVRFMQAARIEPGTPIELREGIGRLFEHFVKHGARACAISLPPDFTPRPVPEAAAAPIWTRMMQGWIPSSEERGLLSHYVFWTLAEFCAEFKLPFDLMIGVNRKVYPGGVFQGQDLFDARCSLIQYKELFNAFPTVKFPVSVLASTMNQELVSYAWIFPNVIPHGHWWYSNIPAYIEPDCRARLQAVPETKQIGYYSDMYKLEFGLPKFNMYRRVLAKVLAEDFVMARRWSEERALRLGRMVLRDNVERTFFDRA